MADNLLRKLEVGFDAQRAGDFVKAERVYRQVLRKDRRNKHALNLLGVLCVNTRRPQEAVDLISRALSVDPDDAQAHANIGLAYKDIARPRSAVKHLAESVRLDPTNPVVFGNLGNVLRLLDQPGKAIRAYDSAIRLQPEFAECWSNLAAALNETGQHEAGLKAAAKAIELNPRLAQAYNNRGDIYLEQARYTEAMQSYEKAVELDPAYTAALINMARVQRDIDDSEAGMQTLEAVLRREPENADALHVMGVLHEQMGDRESAASCFKRAIAIVPDMTVSHYNLAQIRGRPSSDEELRAMLDLWESDELSSTSRMHLAYGLYRVFEQRERYDEAFARLAEGNRIKALTSSYDDREVADYLAESVAGIENLLSRLGVEAGDADDRPVFVIGMPRSGTSLTEQILASHSEISGAGEVSYAFDTVHRINSMTGQSYPTNLRALTAEQLRELGEYYMSCHAEHNKATRYLVDKSPLNFQYLGLLAMALPNARFVHCHRDPIANCFAIHRIPFDKRQAYAHDLAALGQYYNRYRALMRDWHRLFPGRILDVRYEDTVADIDAQARRMLGFLELGFEDSVLDFYKTKRLVKTPSASQVREPIYKDAIAMWKNYEKHLGPLIEKLKVSSDE